MKNGFDCVINLIIVNIYRVSPAKSNKSSDYDRSSRESSVTRLPSITQRNKRFNFTI